jgi:L-fuconolactonase
VLEEFDLTYDLLLFPKHLPVACQLVRRFPNQRFVLDHIAKPFIKPATMEPWATDIRRLAAFPNVFCKVSGMVTEADWNAWTPQDIHPYLDVVFDAFGSERIMFGSDWPVCTVAGTYFDVVDILSRYMQQLSEEDKTNVWGRTAIRFYELE